MTERKMSEPFIGTGAPPEGWVEGTYTEIRHLGSTRWMSIEPRNWFAGTEYRYELPVEAETPKIEPLALGLNPRSVVLYGGKPWVVFDILKDVILLAAGPAEKAAAPRDSVVLLGHTKDGYRYATTLAEVPTPTPALDVFVGGKWLPFMHPQLPEGAVLRWRAADAVEPQPTTRVAPLNGQGAEPSSFDSVTRDEYVKVGETFFGDLYARARPSGNTYVEWGEELITGTSVSLAMYGVSADDLLHGKVDASSFGGRYAPLFARDHIDPPKDEWPPVFENIERLPSDELAALVEIVQREVARRELAAKPAPERVVDLSLFDDAYMHYVRLHDTARASIADPVLFEKLTAAWDAQHKAWEKNDDTK